MEANVPELPEAESLARQVREAVVGCRIHRVRVGRRDVVRENGVRIERAMAGRCVAAVDREGKRVRLCLDDGTVIVFALGMTGRLEVVPSHSATRPHTHLRVRIEPDGRELRFVDARRFGGVWVLTGESADSVRDVSDRPLAALGPDALTISWTRFAKVLAARRQLKALLLDQYRIAGLGNIYVDEALFRAGLHPLTPAASLDADSGKRLLRAIKHVLRHAIAAGGSTIRDYRGADGEPGYFQIRHQVYDRAGEPCRRCNAMLVRLRVAGRGTTICPVCQPAKR
jgi:formamidopyrimidine-DNA glycosylase